MLRELILSLRTRCEPGLVGLGYRYAAVACAGRAVRCAAAWAPHQAATRRQILAAIADAPAGKGTAVIFGSGPCLDLPTAELITHFARVVLVDVAHPPDARRLARRHSAIQLLEQDVTGVATALADRTTSSVPVPGRRDFLDDLDVGLVVSTNLVSQLPLVPLRHVAKRWPDADLGRYGHAIVAAHVAHMRAFACPALLIGDVQRRVIAPNGQATVMEDPLFGFRLPPGEAEWDWAVAPVGELSGGWSIVNRVRATRIDRWP